MFRKSKISCLIATVSVIAMWKELHGLDDFLLMWFGTFAVSKALWWFFKRCFGEICGEFKSIFSPGSFQFEENLTDSICSRLYGSAKRSAQTDNSDINQRIWKHYQAQNNAVYQATKAREANMFHPGSRDAYLKNNRARNARNEANRPY